MNWKNFTTAGTLAGVLFLLTDAGAQQKDRDAMVRDDRSAMQDSAVWIYNDVETGFQMAEKDARPLLIVFR
mgnify:CR=1 FL=1